MNLALLCAAAGVAVALDQATKHLAARHLSAPERHGPGVRLRLVRSPRLGTLGLATGTTVLLWIAAVAVLAAALAVGPPEAERSSPALAIGLGLTIGGATGNLADRLFRGHVVDFIALWRWPTFNLADAAIVAGAVLVAGGLL